tara:strand:+ start:600 stop:1034 length:435 start_codon:yes stop_codon:yes gene_type:complete
MVKSRGKNVENKIINTKLLNQNNDKIIKILKRDDFLEISSKFRVRAKGLNLQGRKRSVENFPSMSNLIRVGFTCSKKVGNAVRRNNAKRRLKHLARECLPVVGKNGWDYIIIGHNKYTEEMNFNDLKKSFITAVNKIHKFEKLK